jgi:hypothetical protein
VHGARIDAGQSIGRYCRRPRRRLHAAVPRPAIACCFEVSSSSGYDLCSRRQALRVASSIAAVVITVCSYAATVQRRSRRIPVRSPSVH